jgi:hypothetical protein
VKDLEKERIEIIGCGGTFTVAISAKAEVSQSQSASRII